MALFSDPEKIAKLLVHHCKGSNREALLSRSHLICLTLFFSYILLTKRDKYYHIQIVTS